LEYFPAGQFLQIIMPCTPYFPDGHVLAAAAAAAATAAVAAVVADPPLEPLLAVHVEALEDDV